MMRAHSAHSPARHKRQIEFFHTNDFFSRFASGRKNYVYKTGVRCKKSALYPTKRANEWTNAIRFLGQRIRKFSCCLDVTKTRRHGEPRARSKERSFRHVRVISEVSTQRNPGSMAPKNGVSALMKFFVLAQDAKIAVRKLPSPQELH